MYLIGNILNQVEFLRDSPTGLLNALAIVLQNRLYVPGDILGSMDQSCHEMYIVLAGVIRGNHGRPTIVSNAAPSGISSRLFAMIKRKNTEKSSNSKNKQSLLESNGHKRIEEKEGSQERKDQEKEDQERVENSVMKSSILSKKSPQKSKSTIINQTNSRSRRGSLKVMRDWLVAHRVKLSLGQEGQGARLGIRFKRSKPSSPQQNAKKRQKPVIFTRGAYFGEVNPPFLFPNSSFLFFLSSFIQKFGFRLKLVHFICILEIEMKQKL